MDFIEPVSIRASICIPFKKHFIIGWLEVLSSTVLFSLLAVTPTVNNEGWPALQPTGEAPLGSLKEHLRRIRLTDYENSYS